MPKDLYPADLSSHKVLDADLGVGNRHLVVISGLAPYFWDLDSDEVAEGELCIHFGEYARDLEQASPYVGLAGIGNEESEFVFAADLARVDLDPATGELSLYIHTALQGEASHFQWIAYQVVVTLVRTGTFIDGTITWPTSLMRPPSTDPSTVAPHITAIANHREMTAGTDVFAPWETLTPVVPGEIQSLAVAADQCKAKYRIDNPPMAMPLKVTVAVDAAFDGATVGRTNGPDVFTLDAMHPSETVDFAVARLEIT
jgi:hypothetical protein